MAVARRAAVTAGQRLASDGGLEGRSELVALEDHLWGTRCIDWLLARNIQFKSGSLRVDWRLFNDNLYDYPGPWLFSAYLTMYEFEYSMRGTRVNSVREPRTVCIM